MKQQEILKKIGSILKELNEQFDYLQAEEMHLNDLELELFAANAKFLTDHNEILRKINAQNQQQRLTLPEHTQTAQEQLSIVPVDNEPATQPQLVAGDTILPPLSAVAVEFEPYSGPAEAYQQPEHKHHNDENVEPGISIEPAAVNDDFGFVRHDSQISQAPHNFSISSHTQEEETPAHVDLTSNYKPTIAQPVEETQPILLPETFEPVPQLKPEDVEEHITEQQPEAETPRAFTPEYNQYTEPVYVPVAEPVFTPEPLRSTEPVEPLTVTGHVTTEPEVSKTEPQPEQPLTLNQRLSEQMSRSGASTSPAQPARQQAVTDIKSAINLNDKMLFVKDLFNGYSLAYSEAIELLNRCKSFEEADRFLKSNYVTKNQWTNKPATADKFYEVLHRRFE